LKVVLVREMPAYPRQVSQLYLFVDEVALRLGNAREYSRKLGPKVDEEVLMRLCVPECLRLNEPEDGLDHAGSCVHVFAHILDLQIIGKLVIRRRYRMSTRMDPQEQTHRE
jgi:hypothetical protein